MLEFTEEESGGGGFGGWERNRKRRLFPRVVSLYPQVMMRG